MKTTLKNIVETVASLFAVAAEKRAEAVAAENTAGQAGAWGIALWLEGNSDKSTSEGVSWLIGELGDSPAAASVRGGAAPLIPAAKLILRERRKTAPKSLDIPTPEQLKAMNVEWPTLEAARAILTLGNTNWAECEAEQWESTSSDAMQKAKDAAAEDHVAAGGSGRVSERLVSQKLTALAKASRSGSGKGKIDGTVAGVLQWAVSQTDETLAELEEGVSAIRDKRAAASEGGSDS